MGKYMTIKDWEHSKYFKKEEFKCGCNGKYCNGYPSGVAKSLVDNMNLLREIYGKSITITSGLRCEKYNATVGGDKNSLHICGQACDWNFTNKEFTQKQKDEIIAFIKKLPNYRYSYSNQTNMYNAIHIDTLLVDCASWIDVSSYEKKIKELDDEIKSLETHILELKVTIDQIEKLNIESNEKIVELKKQLDQSEKEKQEVIKELEETMKELEESNVEYEELFHIGKLYLCTKKEM